MTAMGMRTHGLVLAFAFAGCLTPPDPVETCDEVVSCTTACKYDTACVQSCKDNADDGARQQYADLLTCQVTNCGLISDLKSVSCLFDICAAELARCHPAGTGDCKEVALCADGCPNGDGICLTGCATSGTLEAQQQYVDAMACVVANCGGSLLKCAACRDLLNACTGGTG